MKTYPDRFTYNKNKLYSIQYAQIYVNSLEVFQPSSSLDLK